jgi:hypothetical protein
MMVSRGKAEGAGEDPGPPPPLPDGPCLLQAGEVLEEVPVLEPSREAMRSREGGVDAREGVEES